MMKNAAIIVAFASCMIAGCARSSRSDAEAASRSPIDLSTPQAAYKSAAVALRDGDVAAVRECFVASPVNQPMLDWLVASAQFRAASDKRFGPDLAVAVEARIATYSARQFGLAMLERMKRTTGERELREEDAVWEVPAERGADGRWRLALIVTNDTEAEAAGVNDLLHGAASLLSQVAAEIDAGRLTTREQVLTALGLEAP